MAVNWSWPKATALATVQSAASALLPLIIGHDLFDLDWLKSLSIAGATGLVTLLRAVIAYNLPAGKATSLVSATIGAAQDAAQATAEAPLSHDLKSTAVSVQDERGARG